MKINLNNVINLRGIREQAFKFAAANYKGGMKNCYSKGCNLFTPIQYALNNVEVAMELRYQCVINGETKINKQPTFIF